MKYRLKMSALTLPLIALLLCVFSSGQVYAADPNLIVHFKMDEGSGTTLLDASGNNNNATTVGTPGWVDSQTGLGKALNLNPTSTSQYATVADNNSLDITGAITLAAWVQPAQQATQDVVRKSIGSTTNGYELTLATTGTAFIRFNQQASTDTYRIDSTSTYPSNGNTWVHIAGTYDGTTMRIYFNGALENSKAGPASITANSTPLTIGATLNGSTASRFYKGRMDEVRVYSRALSAAEIADLATLPPPPVSADLSITVTDGLAQAYPGDPVTYTIVVSNSGPDNVTGATVTDNFPAALTGVSWTCAGASLGTCTASGSGNINDTVNLPVSGSVTYTVNATFSASAVGYVDNTASVALPTGGTDPTPANNTATDETFMTGTGDLSLLLHLKMNGDLLDSSVYLNDAVGTGSPAYGPGKDGQALVLNGTSQYATVADDVSLDVTNAITLAAWVKPEQQATQDLIKKATNGGINGFELSLAALNSGTSPGTAFVRLNQQTSGETYRVDSSTQYPFDGNTWVHLAATYDGTTIRFYYNGVEQTTKPGPASIATNGLPVSVGAQFDGSTSSRWFKGGIDDVRIYNRALTPGEIRRLAGLCLGDLGTPAGTPDGDVDGSDVAAFIAAMTAYDPDADFNGDAVVNGADLEFFAGSFGKDDCP